MLAAEFAEMRAQGFFAAAPLEPRDGIALRYAQGGTRLLLCLDGLGQARSSEPRLSIVASLQGVGWPRVGRQRHVEALLGSVMEQAIDCEAYPEAELCIRAIVVTAGPDIVSPAINGALIAATALGLRMRSTYFCFPLFTAAGRLSLCPLGTSAGFAAVVADLFSERIICVDARSNAEFLEAFDRESAPLKASAAELLRSFFVNCLQSRVRSEE